MTGIKIFIITGSTRGIGLGITKELLAAGHKVVLNGIRAERLEQRLEKLGLEYPDVVGLAGDVCKESTHSALIDLCIKQYGRVDYYINNAGVPQQNMKFHKLDTSAIQHLCSVNITAAMIGTKVAINAMEKQGHGKIFNVEGFGSTGEMRDKISLYGASKRLINYFTKSVAKEIKGSCVQLGIISPGMVRTDFLDVGWENNTPEENKKFEKVYRILGEDVDVVSRFIIKGLLKSTKHYDRIEFLTGFKLFFKIMCLVFTR